MLCQRWNSSAFLTTLLPWGTMLGDKRVSASNARIPSKFMAMPFSRMRRSGKTKPFKVPVMAVLCGIKFMSRTRWREHVGLWSFWVFRELFLISLWVTKMCDQEFWAFFPIFHYCIKERFTTAIFKDKKYKMPILNFWHSMEIWPQNVGLHFI